MGFLHICTLQTANNWSSQVHLLDNIDQALRNGITSNYATKDVDKDGRDFGVASNEIEGRSNSFRSGTSTNIQKIRRRATVKLDYIHRCHSEASPIH